MTTKKEKRQKRRVSSARETAEKNASFDRPALKLPEGIELWKPKQGAINRIDIIPYEVKGDKNPNSEDGMLHYERTYYTHTIGPNNESYPCLRKNSGKRCIVCDHRAKLASDPDTAKEASAYNSKKRQLFNIIDLSAKDKGIQIWECSFHNFGKNLDKLIKSAEPEDQEAYDHFHDPESGLTVKFSWDEEEAGQYKYYEATGIELRERKEQYEESIVDDAHNLDDVVKNVSAEKIKAVFLQIGDDDESNDDTETPKANKKVSKEDDDDEPEEADTKPKRKASKAASDDSDDDDDDDDDETPDDDDDGDGNKEDQDDDDGDSEEPEDDEADSDVPAVGTIAAFTYKGKKLEGKVVKVNEKKSLAHIKCKDRSEPHIVSFDDLNKLAEEKASKKTKHDVDFDDDDDD